MRIDNVRVSFHGRVRDARAGTRHTRANLCAGQKGVEAEGEEKAGWTWTWVGGREGLREGSDRENTIPGIQIHRKMPQVFRPPANRMKAHPLIEG